MKSHKMNKVYKIIYKLSAKEHKILIEKIMNDESGEWKITIQYEFFVVVNFH